MKRLARASLVVFVLSFQGTMPDFAGSLRSVLNPNNLDFHATWMAPGAAFATIIFAVSVVSIPMILERRTDAITAGHDRSVLGQPGATPTWRR